MLFFVQDNKYAISVPVSEQTAGGSPYKLGAGYEGLVRARVDGTDFFKTAAVARAAIEYIRAGNGPALIVADVVRLFPPSSSDNHMKYRTTEELELDRQIDPIARLELALVEAGMLNAKSIAQLREEVHQSVDQDAVWADSQPDPAPDTAARHVFFEGEVDITYEASTPAGEPIVMVDAINHALHEEMERDARVIVYGEDVAGGKGGVFTATRELTARFGVDRCFNSPLAEDSIIGTAVGISAAGYKPVVEIQFADYIWPALQQLRNQLSTFRYRSNGAWAPRSSSACPAAATSTAGFATRKTSRYFSRTCRVSSSPCPATRPTQKDCSRRPSASRIRSSSSNIKRSIVPPTPAPPSPTPISCCHSAKRAWYRKARI